MNVPRCVPCDRPSLGDVVAVGELVVDGELEIRQRREQAGEELADLSLAPVDLLQGDVRPDDLVVVELDDAVDVPLVPELEDIGNGLQVALLDLGELGGLTVVAIGARLHQAEGRDAHGL